MNSRMMDSYLEAYKQSQNYGIRFPEYFIITVILFGLFVIFLFTFKCPREMILMGRRWEYSNRNLEPSKANIKYTKITSALAMIIIAFWFIKITIDYFSKFFN